jgi:hypothetical protein
MKPFTAFLLLGTLGMIGCGKPDLTCNVIHEPAKGCPQGYVRENKPRFTERDGSTIFACVSHDPKKERCTDELRSGESVTIQLFWGPQ